MGASEPWWFQPVLILAGVIGTALVGIVSAFRKGRVPPAGPDVQIAAGSMFATQPIADLTTTLRNVDGTLHRITDQLAVVVTKIHDDEVADDAALRALLKEARERERGSRP